MKISYLLYGVASNFGTAMVSYNSSRVSTPKPTTSSLAALSIFLLLVFGLFSDKRNNY